MTLDYNRRVSISIRKISVLFPILLKIWDYSMKWWAFSPKNSFFTGLSYVTLTDFLTLKTKIFKKRERLFIFYHHHRQPVNKSTSGRGPYVQVLHWKQYSLFRNHKDLFRMSNLYQVLSKSAEGYAVLEWTNSTFT